MSNQSEAQGKSHYFQYLRKCWARTGVWMSGKPFLSYFGPIHNHYNYTYYAEDLYFSHLLYFWIVWILKRKKVVYEIGDTRKQILPLPDIHHSTVDEWFSSFYPIPSFLSHPSSDCTPLSDVSWAPEQRGEVTVCWQSFMRLSHKGLRFHVADKEMARHVVWSARGWLENTHRIKTMLNLNA